ncbi:protein of unknown function DUF558 [Gloeothece citriformis PCC 7424]|uniref:Ribosomal RNA small subunit methyltransferase E n=1 Tax=Gloeothece citriformis (strain PCC 7424) TaxID=65393 RepID=B7K758_GLOC7|nr:16S rRNA (uracil(1498)-N(3))-methyltransferase [Gloeothece citriformis]ACK69626.1 protein of unknown function DUF558 [Gloeothece citriformis PCC 7424]
MTYRLVIEPTQKQQEWVNLTEQQLHYLRRVLRLKNGAHFIVMDGQGNVWNAILHENSAQLLDIITTSTELSIKLTLMVALPKGNGFEDIVRSCTELGVNTFIPVISERTLLNPSPQKVERWRKIAIEAAEQSEREIIPQIFEPINFPTALTKIKEIETNKYICVTRREEVNHLFIHLQKPLLNSLVVATGPEGGWTNLEVQTAIKAGFEPVSLGRRILRAVTAPVYIASLVSAVGETHSMS